MPKRTDVQLARQDLVDTIRTFTGLEARVALRVRRNELETAALEEFDRRVAAGESYKVAVKRAARKAIDA